MKRMTAIVLALALMVCLVPAGVFAATSIEVAGKSLVAGEYTFEYDTNNNVTDITAIASAPAGSPVHLTVSYVEVEGSKIWTLDFNADGLNIVNNNGNGIYASDARITISGTVGNITGSANGIDSYGNLDISGSTGAIRGNGSGICSGGSVTISGTVNGDIAGSGNGAGIYAYEDVIISGTVKGNITGYYGIYANDGNIDISGTVKGNITGDHGSYAYEDVIIRGTVKGNIAGGDYGTAAFEDVIISGTVEGDISGGEYGIIGITGVTITGTVEGDITGGGYCGIDAGVNVTISGTVKGEISGGRNGIMGGGSVTISGTVNGVISSTSQNNAIAAIMAGSGITITNNDIKVLDDGEEEGEIQQYADAAGSTVRTVMAKGETTPAKKVKLVRPASSAPVPLIPQVNVPVYRLPEYIEAEEVIDEAQPEEVPGDVADVEEGTCDSTIEE